MNRTGLIALIGFLLLTFGVVIYVGPQTILTSLVIRISEDTEYGAGYSEAVFRSIKVGDTEADVRAALGPPLSERGASPFTRWLYAPDLDLKPWFEEKGEYPDTSYSFTRIEFDEAGVFKSAFGQISHGTKTGLLGVSVSGSFGDGVNTLSLTDGEIEKLKQEKATVSRIEASFGKPMAVYQSKVTKWLYYSRSPGSNHYRQRYIGFDSDGKVCRKRSEIYWD